ncbi:MAG: hypothetical protein AB9834_02740 [Lentimicrobium sp.]
MSEQNINIVAIIWITIFVIGTVIGFIQDRNDKKPKGKKTYRVRTINHISRLNFPVNFFLISILVFGIGVLASTMLFRSIYIVGLCGILLIICAIFLGYNSFIAILLHIQYFRLEKNRLIEINRNERTICFRNIIDKTTIVLEENEISRIELHQSKGNLKKPTAEYEFIKFVTNSGQEFIITSLQTEIFNLNDFYRYKNKKYIYTRMNWIK